MDRHDATSLAVQSLLLLLLLAVVVGFFEYGNYRRDREIAELSIQRNLDLLKLRFDSDLQQLADEVTSLAYSPALKRYLSSEETTDLALVQDGFMSLSAQRGWYDQVRYIDRHGRERVRVDRRDGISWLNRSGQDKLHRDYVQAGLALTGGQIYVSEIDLNIEYGQVEVPYQPMVRVVAPVELNGVQQGLTVLNAHAEVLLERLQQTLPKNTDLVMLNSRGGWIAGGSEHNWGFVFNPEAGLAQEAPSIWQVVSRLDKGHFEHQGGCYHFSWYQANLDDAQVPRWLLAQRNHHSCSVVATAAVQEGTAHLLMAASFSLPLLWLWHGSRMGARRLQRQQDVMRAQLQIVTQQADLGLLMVDRECRVRWVNPEAQRLLGWSQAELLGQNLHHLVHTTPEGEAIHEGECPTLRALQSGQRYRNDNDRMLSRSGEILQLSVRVNAFGDGDQRQAIVTLADVSEQVERERVLERLATTDPLTGVLNRRSILQSLRVLLDKPDSAACVIMADIDFFKKVNDTYGHNTGDRVLVEFAKTVRQLLRRGDLLGRLGGEEFVVVIDHAPLDSALALAERIRQAVQNHTCVAEDGSMVNVTSSFGVARQVGDETAEQLLGRADQALYKAKHGGRNRVEYLESTRVTDAVPE